MAAHRGLVVAAVVGLCGCQLAGCTAEKTPASDAPANPYGALASLPDWSGAWIKDGAQSTIFADCCVPGQGTAPLQPEYQAIRDKAAKIIIKGLPGGDNLARCLPDGMPGILLHGVAFEFMFTPGRVTMITENGELRRIHTDGRGFPPAEELYRSTSGYSLGHWEGDTLVVETRGMHTNAMMFLVNEIKVSKQAQIHERMHLKDKDTLQVDTVIADPVVFTKPYAYSLTYVRGLREEEFVVGCMQNNRDNGSETDLTPPPEE
jgi:hypothetical protein